MKAIVLHSGGLDSTVVLAKAIDDGAEEVVSLGVKYGSLHNEAEAIAALKVVGFYIYKGLNISREVINLPSDVFHGGRSALMGDIPMPELTYAEIAKWEGESPTVVPYRNGVLLSLAAALAESKGFDWIYAGMHGDDANNWNYPDCTPEFLGSQAAAIYVGTYHRVRLSYPLDFMSKAEVCSLGVRLDAPLAYSWSCYAPVLNPHYSDERDPKYIHCGRCPTCIERHQAFVLNSLEDPTDYAVQP
jgi:7-cyano-7-deazaguanine synthase